MLLEINWHWNDSVSFGSFCQSSEFVVFVLVLRETRHPTRPFPLAVVAAAGLPAAATVLGVAVTCPREGEPPSATVLWVAVVDGPPAAATVVAVAEVSPGPPGVLGVVGGGGEPAAPRQHEGTVLTAA